MKIHYIHRLSPTQQERLVGFFLLISVSVIVLVVFLLGKKEYFFEKKYRLRAEFHEGEGIKEETELILSGFKIGVVESVHLNEENRVDIILKIRKKFQKKITVNSKAMLYKPSFLGDVKIKIIPGKASNNYLQTGDTIMVERAFSLENLEDRVKPILDNAEKALNKIVDIINNIPVNSGVEIAENVRSIVKKIDKGEGPLGALISDRKMLIQIEKTLDKAEDGIELFNVILKDINKTTRHLPVLTKNVETITEGLAKLTVKMDRNISSALKDLTSTLQSVQETTVELSPKISSIISKIDSTVDDLRKTADDIPEIFERMRKILSAIEDIKKIVPFINDAAKKNLPEMLENINRITRNILEVSETISEVAENTSEIVKGARKSWPIKALVGKKKKPQVPKGGLGKIID